MTDRTHYCAGCKGREDIIKKLEAEVERLTLTVRKLQGHQGALEADNARLREALGVWDDKTVWVQKTVQPHEIGLHRADVLRHRVEAQAREIERLHETLRSRGVVIEYKRGFSAGDGDSAVLQETSHDA